MIACTSRQRAASAAHEIRDVIGTSTGLVDTSTRQMDGPARRVTAFNTVLFPDRVTKEGVPFHIDTPDWAVAAVELVEIGKVFLLKFIS